MSWKPNPNATPFQPSNAYYSIKLPCCQNAWKIRKKGLLGRCVQWTLVLILLITVVVNVLFIMDTTSKFRKQQLNPKGEGKGFEERRQVIIGTYYYHTEIYFYCFLIFLYAIYIYISFVFNFSALNIVDSFQHY